MKTSGNIILIVGGTSGIGLGLAQRFREAGNTVIVAGRRAELIDEIVATHDGIEGVVLDVTDSASIANAFQTVTGAHPGLNAVVTMSGIMLPEDLLDPRHIDVAERTVATNLLGTIRVLAAFTPFLAGQRDATVITVSSGLGFVPLPLTPTYSATKAAIHSFTQSLRVQLAGTGVQVLELIPPAVRTALMGQENMVGALPLDDFLTEAMSILNAEPDATEILVERVKPLRFAEVDGTFEGVLAGLGSH